MNSSSIKDTKKEEEPNQKNLDNQLTIIKSNYFLQKLFDYIPERTSLEIIRFNITTQKRLNININNYKKCAEIYSPIEIEIVPRKNKIGQFINIKDKKDEKYYHIYFNDNKEEVKKRNLTKEDTVSKIKIKINHQIESFEELFNNCECIESIDFKLFYRINITNMKSMFNGCSSLKELNLSNFNTNKVNDMSCMFSGCSSLKELNLNNFNTHIINQTIIRLYNYLSKK